MILETIQEIGISIHAMIPPIVHEIAFSVYNVFLIPMIFFSILFYLLAFSGIFLKPEKRRIFKNLKWPMVTVQIPTYNEPVALRCAEKCLNFDYPKEKLEIIIGDDSNDHEVSSLIDDFAEKHSDIVKVTRRGLNIGFKAGNLNHMLKYSNGEIIVIFDSDFVPPKNFLKKVIPSFLKDEKVGCVQAKWKYMNMNQNRVSKLASASLMVYHYLLAPINNKNDVSLLFGSGQAVRKDILVKLGGWQEGSLTEDVEFSVRLLKNGYKTVYLPDFQVSGEVPYTLKGFFKQQKRWAYGNARAFLQHAKWILFGKKLSLLQKSSLIFTLIGYISAPLLVLFTLFGIVAFMTGEIAPINVPKLVTQTVWIFFVNSGFLTATIVALSKEKKLGMTLSVLASSVTVGFIISIGVTVGLIKAFLGRKMRWSMIQKKGNMGWMKSS